MKRTLCGISLSILAALTESVTAALMHEAEAQRLNAEAALETLRRVLEQVRDDA